MSRLQYPSFACQHCGIANGDMFYDWFISKYNREPDLEEWANFSAYRDLWNELKAFEEKGGKNE